MTQGREAQWRPCRPCRPCRLAPAQLKDVADWVEHYRRFREQSFDQLDNYQRDIQTKEKKRGRSRDLSKK